MYADSKAEVLRVLQTGTMEIEGVLPWSSNYAFLVRVCEEAHEFTAVYKPRRGERPLWDFPRGTLSFRERAAFIVSDSLGWDLVPPTVLRKGGHGLGSVQLFIAHDPNQHYFSLEGDPHFRLPLQKMTLLDYAINNADRKGGHVIIERTDGDCAPLSPVQLWGIDHGICFHSDHKLRTVIWEYAGDPIPEELLADLEKFHEKLKGPGGELRSRLTELLSEVEYAALNQRVGTLLTRKVFPVPGPGRHYPWPPV